MTHLAIPRGACSVAQVEIASAVGIEFATVSAVALSLVGAVKVADRRFVSLWVSRRPRFEADERWLL